jgi:hypothetical protein
VSRSNSQRYVLEILAIAASSSVNNRRRGGDRRSVRSQAKAFVAACFEGHAEVRGREWCDDRLL